MGQTPSSSKLDLPPARSKQTYHLARAGDEEPAPRMRAFRRDRHAAIEAHTGLGPSIDKRFRPVKPLGTKRSLLHFVRRLAQNAVPVRLHNSACAAWHPQTKSVLQLLLLQERIAEAFLANMASQ
jgi:hypothetical protein